MSGETADVTSDEVVCGGSRLLLFWPPGAAAAGSEAAAAAVAASEAAPAGGWARWPARPRALGAGARVRAVWLVHGRGGSKDKMRAKAARLAEQLGCVVVLGDLPNHGEGVRDARRNLAWADGNLEHAADMYGQMLAAVRELQVQLDLLPALADLVFERVAVLGISQGGHTALLAATHEPRIDVCVALIGTCDFLDNMVARYLRLGADADGSKPTFEVSRLGRSAAAAARQATAAHQAARDGTAARKCLTLQESSLMCACLGAFTCSRFLYCVGLAWRLTSASCPCRCATPFCGSTRSTTSSGWRPAADRCS
jgi:dienelactone hydrolase